MVVQDIQEVAQYLELKLKITMSWRDARVSYYNIKKKQDMNSLTIEEQQKNKILGSILRVEI